MNRFFATSIPLVIVLSFIAGCRSTETTIVETAEIISPPPFVLTEAQEKAGWEVLFDGRNTECWRGFGSDSFPGKGWVVDDDSLHIEAGSGAGDIMTRGRFGDFELRLEWKVSHNANSGIMYLVSEDENAPWRTGPEFQILDDLGHGLDAQNLHSAGALYGLYPPPAHKPQKPAGQWNEARVKIRNGRVEHWHNGVRVAECDLESKDWADRVKASKFAPFSRFGRNERGHIALQDHGHDVWFRKIRIRDLTPDPARKTISLFNGKNMEGWRHHFSGGGKMADTWIVEDGVMICRGSPAGYIYTDREFSDFLLRLEWRFDPVTKKAGNSGVLMRRTGRHKVWPKSLEAQLHSGNAGDFWVIDGFPVTTDPARTRGRNTKKTHFNENPVGEWNEYEISCVGGDVILIVNGEVLNEATGANGAFGPICLQSEGAEIHFRNIAITPLDERKDVRHGWKLGVQAWTFRKFSFFDAVDMTASLGLGWIEAFPGQSLGKGDALFHHSMPAEARAAAKEKLADAGVTVINYGVVGLPNDETECRKVFDFAEEMGIETIVSEPAPDAFDLVDRLCREYRIKMAIHNHPKPTTYWSPDIVLDALEGRSRWMGACADTGHWTRSGIDSVEALRKLEGRVISFHLKDLNLFGDPRKAHDVPWGTGQSNVMGILDEMKRQGFRGVFSVEYEYNWDNSLPDIRKCVHFFNNAAGIL